MIEEQMSLEEKWLGKVDIENPSFQARIGKSNPLTHISLFTGCGGIDLGFAAAGIETRVMLEWDKSCCMTLRHNWTWEKLKERKRSNGTFVWKSKEHFLECVKRSRELRDKAEGIKQSIGDFGAPTWYHEREPVIMQRDIREVTTKEILDAAGLQIGECSIITGGFPCQGFSLAGKRVIDDPRNSLYKEFVRIVNEAKPAMIFGENVPGIVSMGKGEVIKQICEDFANCGYDITWDILNAADFGVPQERKRVILIGKRVDAMRVSESGNISFHIAAAPGEIKYPQLFFDRLKRWKSPLLEEINQIQRQQKPAVSLSSVEKNTHASSPADIQEELA